MSAWTPPTGVLGELTTAGYSRAEAARSTMSELEARARDLPTAPSFAAALRGDFIKVIAEVKRSSPSKGPIAEHLNAAAQAREYAIGGAAAISVLTEPTRFGGGLDDLAQVSAAVTLPVIRKDFLVDEVQLWEARVGGAAAALLIVRALGPERLARLLHATKDAGIEALVEVRDERELEWAMAAGAMVLGINNRNLETLVVDPNTAPALLPSIPGDRMAVAESGIRDASDVYPSARAGADAILVGSAMSSAVDPASAVRGLTRIPRASR